MGAASGTVSAADAAPALTALEAGSGDAPPAPWRVVALPKGKAEIPVTRFHVGSVQGERALQISADASYGTLVHDWRGPAARLQWRWRLDLPLSGGRAEPDTLTKAGDDAALKVCVMFDHPLQRVPFIERNLLRLARSLSGEDLPAATLCYVWDSSQSAGLEAANPYTRRVRFISLQGRGAALARWQSESRDVAADFARLFADEHTAGTGVPAVRAVLVGADGDNTGSKSLGWVSSLKWLPP